MTERAVLVDRGQPGLECVVEERVPMLPEEDKQLGALDAMHDRLLGGGWLDGRLPGRRMHGSWDLLCWEGVPSRAGPSVAVNPLGPTT
jgi:hypothetical protein